jgi:hypothetical protein
MNDQVFVGSWLVSYLVGKPPSVLTRELINPLFAKAAVSFLAGGALIASGSPAYPVPNQATSGDRLLVGTGCGSWAMTGELTATVRFAVLLRHEDGNTVATVFVDAIVQATCPGRGPGTSRRWTGRYRAGASARRRAQRQTTELTVYARRAAGVDLHWNENPRLAADPASAAASSTGRSSRRRDLRRLYGESSAAPQAPSRRIYK